MCSARLTTPAARAGTATECHFPSCVVGQSCALARKLQRTQEPMLYTTPATAPMMSAAQGYTVEQPAVMATRPASTLLPNVIRSACPETLHLCLVPKDDMQTANTVASEVASEVAC
jgi:hypothetical protein